MRRLLGALQSTSARALFVVAALAFGVWAVVTKWDAILAAVQRVNGWLIVAALVVSVVYVIATFWAWRGLLVAQQADVPPRAAARIFFLSQLGKYLPGGIWNIVAAAELGKDHAISRVHSVVVMLQSTIISIATGLALGGIGIAFGPAELRANTWWVLLALPFVVALVIPRVLNALVGFVLAKTGRTHTQVTATWHSVGVAAGWSIVAWLLAGLQLWLLGIGLGLTATVESYGLSVLAYALAWTVGFLTVFAPAGIGVREGVMALLLAGYLSSGAVVAIVLLSRLALTLADVLLGLVALRGGVRARAAS